FGLVVAVAQMVHIIGSRRSPATHAALLHEGTFQITMPMHCWAACGPARPPRRSALCFSQTSDAGAGCLGRSILLVGVIGVIGVVQAGGNVECPRQPPSRLRAGLLGWRRRRRQADRA